MRIAVFHNLPPGGARRAAFELVRHTADVYDYDYYRITSDRAEDPLAGSQDIGKWAKEVFAYDLKGRRFGPDELQRVLNIRSMVSLQRNVARDIDARGYDLVFVHHDRLTHAPALLRFLTTPSVYYVQEPRRQSFEYNLRHRNRPVPGPAGRGARLAASTFDLWLRERDIRGTRAATHLVANSYHSAEFIWRSYGRHPAVSYLGVDPDVFSLGTGERQGVLAVGALDPTKGHDLVIEAIGQLPAAVRPPLTLAFDRERPGVRNRLLSLAAARGVLLQLRNGIDDAQLVALYQTSSATICAGAVEPFGLTTVESLACGTPVVALKEGGYREVVKDGQNGSLADRRPGAITAAIAQVTADPGRWSPAELRSSVLPFFSWEAASERFKALLEEAVETECAPADGRHQ